MSHNIKFLLISIVSSFLVGMSGCYAQRVQELSDYDNDSTQVKTQTEVFKQFQISADLSAITAGLMGGVSPKNLHIGLQSKWLRNRLGYRFQIEFYPNSQYQYPFGHGPPVDIVGNEVVFLSRSTTGRLLRSGFGVEYQLSNKRNRTYMGIDIPVSYEHVTTSAHIYSVDVTGNDQVGGFLGGFNQANSLVTNGFGVGSAPFFGYELRAGKRLGFNIETKLDFNLIFSEGVFVDNNATITKTGTNFYFRTFPLLDFRIHYRI